jgi:hypothetical protein
MNWGWKLTLVYSLFVAGILTLVFKARSEKVDLVATDYYAQELAYSQRLEAQRNASLLQVKPKAFQQEDNLIVEIPVACESLTNGNIHVYCPADAALDQKLLLTNDTLQSFPVESLTPGIYLIKFSFQLNEKPYYIEQAIEWK